MAKSSLRPLATTRTARKASEERRAERHRYIQFLWFHRLEAGGHGIAQSVDVSDEGLGFITSGEIAVGERLFMIILTPFGRISTIACVVHTSQLKASHRIGVRLEVVPPTDKATWAMVVAGKETAR